MSTKFWFSAKQTDNITGRWSPVESQETKETFQRVSGCSLCGDDVVADKTHWDPVTDKNSRITISQGIGRTVKQGTRQNRTTGQMVSSVSTIRRLNLCGVEPREKESDFICSGVEKLKVPAPLEEDWVEWASVPLHIYFNYTSVAADTYRNRKKVEKKWIAGSVRVIYTKVLCNN